MWERNWRAISTDSEGSHLPVQDLHSVKKRCFDTSFTVIGFNWRQQPPPPKKKTGNVKKFDQRCRKVEHRCVGGMRGKKTMWPQSLIFDKGKQQRRL